MEPGKKLTLKQRRFIEEHLLDLNATQAAIRAGYSKRNASRIGAELLGKTHVADAITAAMKERGDKANINAQKVLKHYWDIATADPRDLVQVRVNPCPDCWPGVEPADHPDDECKTCRGRGIYDVVVSDTRKLSGPAKALFKGAKMGRYGVEVQMHDQLDALDSVAEHIGFFSEKQPGADQSNPLHILIQQIQGSVLRPVPQSSITNDHDETEN
jgi:phage terminase small subunit